MHREPIIESEEISVLTSMNAFRELTESSLELLTQESTRLGLHTGDVLFEEGDVDDAIYVVLSGTLDMVAKRGGERRQTVVSYGVGDCIGETLVLFHRPRPGTVYATGPSELLKLPLS